MARTADIIVTFPHRTVQEFLGAVFLVKMLDAGLNIESLLSNTDKAPIYLVNPLFLHFCLFLVYSDQNDFKFLKKETVRLALARFAAKHIDTKLNMLNVEETFPAFDISYAHDRKDELRLQFFKDVLANCARMKILVLDSWDHLDWFLTSLQPVLHNISSIFIPRVLDMHIGHENHIMVTLRKGHKDLIRTVMTHCNCISDASMNVKIDLGKKSTVDLTSFLQMNFKALRIIGSDDSQIKIDRVPSCPNLAALFIERFTVRHKVLKALSDAICRNSLPSVKDISFVECKGLKNKLKLLFNTQWGALESLNLHGCLIRIDDLKAIVGMSPVEVSSEGKNVPMLPHLVSLTLSIAELCPQDRREGADVLFQSNFWKQLTVLQLDTKISEREDYVGDDYLLFEHVLNEGKIPHLRTIGINRAWEDNPVVLSNLPLEDLSVENVMLHACLASIEKFVKLSKRLANLNINTIAIRQGTGMGDQLSTLLDYQFLSLTCLVLSNCRLTNVDLKSLTTASLRDRLPALSHLDISENYMNLKNFFHRGCKWEKLKSLDVKGMKGSRNFGKVRLDRLISLEEITFSCYESWHKEICWSKLHKLCIHDCKNNDKVLNDIALAIEQRFQSLKTVCISGKTNEIVNFDAVCKLAKHNVDCHLCSPISQPFTRARCACQSTYPFTEITGVSQTQSSMRRNLIVWLNRGRKWRSKIWKMFKKLLIYVAVLSVITVIYHQYINARNIRDLDKTVPWTNR